METFCASIESPKGAGAGGISESDFCRRDRERELEDFSYSTLDQGARRERAL